MLGSKALRVVCLAAYLPLVVPFAQGGMESPPGCGVACDAERCANGCARHEDHGRDTDAPDAERCPCPLCPARDDQGGCVACFLCVKCVASCRSAIFDERPVTYHSFSYLPPHSEAAAFDMLKPPRR
jgi:hypothetical protein